MFRARRWAWIDVEHDGPRAARVRMEGPFEGTCPGCGDPAYGDAPWVAVRPTDGMCWLMMDPSRRGEALDALRWHHDVVQRCEEPVPSWLLSPRLTVERARDGLPPWELELPTDAHPSSARSEGIPVQLGVEVSGVTEVGELSAHVGSVSLDEEGAVRVRVPLDSTARAHWGTAALSVRPIHLRDLGYPVLGVRVLASYLGRVSVIDGVLDPSEEEAGQIIETLCQDFRVFVELQGVEGSATIVREVSTAGLHRNAALCLESARAILAAGDFPPPAWAAAVEALAGRSVAARLRPAHVQIGAGDYQYIVSAQECWSALEHLDAVSSTENLARLLEVDGMPVAEFEELRRRVLAQSIAFGICAPRRFWRRVIASGLCESPARYVEALAGVRLHIDDDEESREALELSPEAEAQSWSRLMAFCDARGLEVPAEVLEAVGLGDGERTEMPPLRASAAGTLGGPESAPIGRGLDDPRRRVGVASDLLLSHAEQDLTGLINALNDFSDDDLIRLLPPMVVAARTHRDVLLAGLGANNPSLRLAVAASFGEAQSPGAVGPLCDLLAREPSELWSDAARALGQIGPVAVGALVRAVAQPDGPDASRVVASLRYLAEFHGADAVAELCAHEVPEVRTAAGRALATLGQEEPEDDAGPLRRFSRRARLRLASTEGMKVAPDPTQVLTITDLEIL